MTKSRKLHSIDSMSTGILENWKKIYIAKTPSEAIRAAERRLRELDKNEKKFRFKI